MKDSYFFKHDSNSRSDPKILAMISVYGMAGYGWFWVLVELLREQNDYKLDLSGKYAISALAMQMYTDCDTTRKFIDDCINEFHLFESDGTNFWSNSLRHRMESLDKKRQQAKKAADKRWENRPNAQEDDAEKMQTQCESDAIREEKSRTDKNRTDKIRKEEETVSDKSDTYSHSNGKNTVPGTKSNAPPFDEVIKAYNRICQTLPKVKVLSDGRRNQIRLRWSKYGKKYGMEFFTELFERANESSFLSGANGKWNGCNFDWLLKEANMIKTLEGNYDD